MAKFLFNSSILIMLALHICYCFQSSIVHIPIKLNNVLRQEMYCSISIELFDQLVEREDLISYILKRFCCVKYWMHHTLDASQTGCITNSNEVSNKRRNWKLKCVELVCRTPLVIIKNKFLSYIKLY